MARAAHIPHAPSEVPGDQQRGPLLSGTMQCPFCRADDTRVIDSRRAEDGETVRRRRRCEQCDNRFTTYERPVLPLLVKKRTGLTEPLDLEKVRRGVERSLAGRPVPEGTVEDIIVAVENAARAASPLVESEEIGQIVLDGLKLIDEAAYLRFASVYKDFQGARDFEREMAALDE